MLRMELHIPLCKRRDSPRIDQFFPYPARNLLLERIIRHKVETIQLVRTELSVGVTVNIEMIGYELADKKARLEALTKELESLSQVASLPIEDVAKENNLPKSANVVLLGMAAKYIEILTPEQLRESIARVFASKGEKVVEANQQAFDLGFGK